MEFLLRHKLQSFADGSTLSIKDEIIKADFFEYSERFVRFYNEKSGEVCLVGLVDSDSVYSIVTVDMDKIIKADIDNVCANIRGDSND